MTFAPANSQTAYLQTSDVFSDDPSQMLINLTDFSTKVANAVNVREIAQYDQVETLTGQQFFYPANAQRKRLAFRRVYTIGTVSAGATLTQAHGLSNITSFTRIYGTCVTSSSDYRPIPFSSAAAVNQQVEIRVDGTNFYIANGSSAPNITSGIIVLEYLKN